MYVPLYTGVIRIKPHEKFPKGDQDVSQGYYSLLKGSNGLGIRNEIHPELDTLGESIKY